MRCQQAIRVALSILLLWIGLVAPSHSEQCCDVSAKICCCADAGVVQCDASICGSSFSLEQPVVCTNLFSLVAAYPQQTLSHEEPVARAPGSIEPNVETELVPPPLFVNETLCFLPPPVAQS